MNPRPWLVLAAVLMPVLMQLHVVLPGSWLDARIAYLIGLGGLSLMLYMAQGLGFLVGVTGGFLIVAGFCAYLDEGLAYRIAHICAQIGIVMTWCELAYSWQLEQSIERSVTLVASMFAVAGLAWGVLVNLMQPLGVPMMGLKPAELALTFGLWGVLAIVMVRHWIACRR